MVGRRKPNQNFVVCPECYGLLGFHNKCPNLSNAKCMAEISSAYLVNDICPVVNRFEP